MNMIIFLVGIIVIFSYYGGSRFPNILKENKKILVGILIGLLLSYFFNTRLEGWAVGCEIGKDGIETNLDLPMTCCQRKSFGCCADEETAAAGEADNCKNWGRKTLDGLKRGDLVPELTGRNCPQPGVPRSEWVQCQTGTVNALTGRTDDGK